MQDVRSGPLVVSGFFSDPRGVGRAARLTATALEQAGFAPVRDDLTPMLRNERLPPLPTPPGGVWLLHCNAPEAAVAMRARAGLAAAPMYRIGAWSWELGKAPDGWIEASRSFHELWTPSAFVAGSLAEAACPVHAMAHPVATCAPADAEEPRMESAGVVFAALADLRSSAMRKNPEAVLRAWELAFPTPGRDRLILKLLAPEADPLAAARLAGMVAARSDVALMDTPLSEAELERFYDRVDVIVSLHRAEGFGLTLAEAMAAGKPVIATGWSGNLEFMGSEDADQLAPFHLVPVVDPSGRYRDGLWAEPDEEAAAMMIVRLASDVALRRRLGAANRERIAGLHARWSREALDRAAFARFCSSAGR